MSSNSAAYLPFPKSPSFEIYPAPLIQPAANQILIKNHAIAINPIDSKLQLLAFYPLAYPSILGQDVAGKVIAVGPNVTRFQPGDRVIGTAAGFSTKQSSENGFQQYTILRTNLAAPLPAHIPYEAGVVIPLGFTTAASGLFNADFLNLQLPVATNPKPTGKVLLVWGGASSVGCNAVQLGVAAGYEVFATASPRNFERVRKLGASRVFDYNSPDVVADLVGAAEGKVVAGAFDAVGANGWMGSAEFLAKAEGECRLVATAAKGAPEGPAGIAIKQMFSLSIMDNHVGEAVWEDFLPEALRSGAFVPAPEPLVAGHGLENIQKAIDLQRQGVSAKKVVLLL